MDYSSLPTNKDLTYIGQTTFRDKKTLFGIKRKDRRQHTYVLGKSGTGKSALMFNMIIQNIINGEGVCVVDPHGELVEGVLSAIPPHRMKDVVYFNPADTDYHIGFNVLELVDHKYKHLVASGLMGIFTKIWANAWSARMEYILNNTILALLDTPGTTLLGVPRMLVDKDYRQGIIANLKDPVIKAFWIHEYEAWQEKFRNEAIAPIQNKVGQFLSTSIIRNVVGQSKSTINIFDIMNEGKIFLVNVSKGRIGEDNSALLGGMIITKIQLAAMERVRIPEDVRKDFYLYVDEFQNFVTDSFASILSEARKYRLNLIVAHQYTAQLVTKNGSAVRDAIFGNVGTMIIFRVGADDAKILEREFEPEFTPEDIVNLPNYKIYLKLMIDGITSRPFSAKTLPPLVKSGNKEIEDQVIESSRKLYCKTREDIEEEINVWSGMVADSGGGDKVGEKFKAVCSVCNKEILLPFKPIPGKPVYCQDDMKKIKEGSIEAIPFDRDFKKKNDSKYYKPLMDLGIEFLPEEKEQNKKEDYKKEDFQKPKENKGVFASIKKVFTPNKNQNQNGQNNPKSTFSQKTNNTQNNFNKNQNPKNNFNNNFKKEEPKNPKENFALKDILNKALSSKEEVIKDKGEVVLTEVKEEAKIPAMSLDSLNKPASININNKSDRSADVDTMNSLKSLISNAAMPVEEKKEEISKEVKIEDKIEEKKIAQNVVPNFTPVQELKKETMPHTEKPIINTQKTEEKVPENKTEFKIPEIPKIEEIKKEEKIENKQENKQEEKTGTMPNLSKQNIQEVPEEVLRKLFEQD
jgi:CxxC-x17-CxxC domain-containing protein